MAEGVNLAGAGAVSMLAATLVLLSPLPQPGEEADLCMRSHRTKRTALGYPVNCDSGLFVTAAMRPRELVTTEHPFQSRPVFIAIPAGVGLVGDEHLVFRAYQLMNFIFLIVAIWLFGQVVSGTGRRWLLLVPFVALNDIVKAFVWTPHTQILNITVPLIGMWLLLNRSAEWSLRRYIAVGSGLGVGILAYGAAIPVVGAMLLFMLLERRRHRPAQGAVLAGMAALPTLAWVTTVIAVRGAFYSHETSRYRQIVWLTDATVEELVSNVATWLRVTTTAVAFPVCFATVAVALAWRHGWRPTPCVVRAAGALTVCLSLFTWALGHYQERLSWPIAVPVLVVAARALTHGGIPRREVLLYGGAVGGWVVWQVATPGPWS